MQKMSSLRRKKKCAKERSDPCVTTIFRIPLRVFSQSRSDSSLLGLTSEEVEASTLVVVVLAATLLLGLGLLGLLLLSDVLGLLLEGSGLVLLLLLLLVLLGLLLLVLLRFLLVLLLLLLLLELGAGGGAEVGGVVVVDRAASVGTFLLVGVPLGRLVAHKGLHGVATIVLAEELRLADAGAVAHDISLVLGHASASNVAVSLRHCC